MGKERHNNKNSRNRLPLAVGDEVTHIYDKTSRGTVTDVSLPEKKKDGDKFAFTGRAFEVTDQQTGAVTWAVADELVRI